MIIKSHKKITDNRLFYMSAQELSLLYIGLVSVSLLVKELTIRNIVKVIVSEWHWSQLGCMLVGILVKPYHL